MPNEQLSRAQARRIALVAQGFRDPRHTIPTMRTFSRTLARTGVLQVDSVNVLQRAHYMPLFSRMGPYDTDDAQAGLGAEAAAHGRVLGTRPGVHAGRPVAGDAAPDGGFRESPRGARGCRPTRGSSTGSTTRCATGGPSTARDLDDGTPRDKVDWGWNWSEARKALDYLFVVGDLAIARPQQRSSSRSTTSPSGCCRRPSSRRRCPDAFEATKELVRRAARSHGVATVRCLTDYYRLQMQSGEGTRAAQAAIDELVEDGELLPVTIEGWKRPAWLHRDAALPRKVDARALLSPFDPVVWERERTEHIFDFHYRIEIYVPEAKRLFGYYVLPFLLGDRDRRAGRPQGRPQGRRTPRQGGYAEPGAPAETAEELAAELRDLASWLGLDDIVVEQKGDLAPALAAVVHS